MADHSRRHNRANAPSIRRKNDRRGKPTVLAKQKHSRQHRKNVEGLINKTRSGAAWFCQPVHTERDARLQDSHAQIVGDGDRVLVNISRGQRRNTAQLVRVLKRAQPICAARVESDKVLEPLGRGMPARYYCKAIDGLEVGDLVVARWEPQENGDAGNGGGQVDILRRLGRPEEAGVATELALVSFQIRNQWPQAAKAEAGQLAQHTAAIVADSSRKDLRDQAFCTIDGATARDFDDAVCCEPLMREGWRLRVAIADVSAYVNPGSAIDKEAAERGTSVYFSDRVVPMLPTELSEDRCSLIPGEDRPAVVCDMSVSASGELTQWSFYRALIRSAARFVYEDVDTALQQPDCNHPAAQGLHAELKAFRQVGQALAAARSGREALQLDIPEVQMQQDSRTHSVQMLGQPRLSSHVLIEDAMLAANTCAANELRQRGQAAPMRICASPTAEKWAIMAEVMQSRGLPHPGATMNLAACNRLLRQMKERPDALFLQRELMRILQQAVYAIDTAVGHFPLALENYSHFTSPIRRYPDLLVHRLLLREYAAPADQQIQQLCEQSSRTERQADAASRQEQRHLKCLLAAESIDQWQSAWLGSIYADGVYVELGELKMRAFLPRKRLDDRYKIVGNRTANPRLQPLKAGGKALSPGAEVEVKIASVCAEKQEIWLAGIRRTG